MPRASEEGDRPRAGEGAAAGPPPVPLRLRNELYALLLDVLPDPSRDAWFDWLAAFSRLRPAGGRVLRGELGAWGQTEWGLDPAGLKVFLERGRVLKASTGSAILPEGEGAWLLDRAPRYREAVREVRGLGVRAGSGTAAEVAVAAALFNNGLYFDCHEYLEPAWRAASGTEKSLLQGLIQAGAGFHQLELGSPAGCLELLGNASRRLHARSPGAPEWAAAFPAFAQGIDEAAERISSGRFDWSQVPSLQAPG